MPRPVANSIHVVFGGNLTESEVFAHGFWFDGEGIVGNTTTEDQFGGVVVIQFNGTFGAAGNLSLFPNTTVWNRGNIYFYGAGGLLTRTIPLSINKAGTVAAATPPNQLCSVLSIRNVAAGRSNRGRSYLPALANSLLSGGTGQWTAASVDAVNTTCAGFLTGVSGDPQGARPVIMSAVKQTMVDVNFVEMDTRPDTQRRRTASSTVVHVASAVVTPT